MKIKEQEYLELKLRSLEGLRDKFMDGIMYIPPKEMKNELSVIQDYDAWITKINSLCKKTNISLNNAIQYTAKITNFSPVGTEDENVFIAQYFIENGVYRLISLWDTLAQLADLLFDCGVGSRRVGYKKFFIDNRNEIKCHNSHNEYYLDFKKRVRNYLKEENNISSEEEWLGNHNYISNRLRNPLVHGEDPHELSVLDCEMNFIDHPIYELKRIIEDYCKVNKFIDELYGKIKEDIKPVLGKYGLYTPMFNGDCK